MSSKKYLDISGLSHFWDKIKDYADGKSIMVANLTYDYNTDGYVVDRTTQEMYEHINNGGYVCLYEIELAYDDVYNVVNIHYFVTSWLDEYDNPTLYFSCIPIMSDLEGVYGYTASHISIDAEGTVIYDSYAHNFYAPYTSGTSGQVLLSNGWLQAPTWGSVPSDSSKANVADVLTKTNTTSYTPSADYHPATKKYVDDKAPLYLEASFNNNEDIVFAGATPAEIVAAFNSERVVYCNVSDWHIIFPLVGVMDQSTDQYPNSFEFAFGVAMSGGIAYMHVTTNQQIFNSDPWLPSGGDTKGPSWLEIPYAMWGLQDVTLGDNISNNQVLTWDSTGNYWTNKSVPSDSSKADVTDVLTLTNAVSYTPTANYHPATKKYVDDAIESSGETMATTVPVGKLFNTGYAYSSWVHNNVKYDATNDVICVMVNNSDSHGSATYRDILLFKLNPRTLEVVDVIDVNKSATSGKQFEVYGFAILSNGTYMFLPCYDTGVSSQSSDKLMVWSSADYGETWTETEATTTSLISQSSYQWFGLTALSSGMLVCTEKNSHSILHSSDSGASWTAQRMSSNSTHEPTFIDCGNNKIICYCRKTMYGTGNGAWNGTKQIEPAVYHTSTDGGVTWTYQGDSTSITEMTACNCACAVHNGYADMYVCSRYPHGDSVGVVYHYFAKLDNVFNDAWGTSKVVLYPSATDAGNFSYMGVAVDSVGTQHAFYYDSTAENQAEIRYFMASRKGVPMPVNADLSNALKIPYSKEKVDALLQTLKSSLTAKINDLIIESGGTVPDEGDATYYVTDGLFEAWDFTNESQYDATTFTQSGIKGVASLKRSGANWGQSTPSDTSFGAQQTIRNYWRNVSTNDFSSVTVANGYSVDFVVKRTAIATIGTDMNASFDVNFQKRDNATSRYAYISSDDGSTKTVWTNLASGTYYALNDYAGQVTHHAFTIDSTELKYYQNGVLKQTVSVSDITDFSTWTSTTFSYTGHLGNSVDIFYPTKLRIYTKVLTQAEIKNNSDYEQSLNNTADTSTTYNVSLSGNVVTIKPSTGTAQTFTLPVYNGGVS